MSNLLYISIVSNLSEAEKLELEKIASRNRLVLREFFLLIPKISFLIVLFIPVKSLAEVDPEFNTHSQLGVSLVQNQIKGGGVFDDFSRNRLIKVLILLDYPVGMTEVGEYLAPGYKNFSKGKYPKLNGRRFSTVHWKNYSFTKFKRLSARLMEDGSEYFTNTSIDQTRAAIQAEQEKLIIKPSVLPNLIAFDIKFPYVVRGPEPLKYIEIITPITEKLSKDADAKRYRAIGQRIAEDKTMYENNEGFDQPLWIAPESIGHVVDLVYIEHDHEDFVKENILIGAKFSRGIIFLNDSGYPKLVE